MDKKDSYLIVAAIVICIIICALSPYIASGDPDGLEKSAEDSGRGEDFAIEEIKGIPGAIFPDYAVAGAEDNQPLQVAVLIIGTIVTLALCYIIAIAVRNRN